MSRITVTAIDCIRIEIRDPDARGMAFLDDRIVCRFMEWTIKEKIFPVRGTSGGSAWHHVGCYEPDDAARAMKWLRAEQRKANAAARRLLEALR